MLGIAARKENVTIVLSFASCFMLEVAILRIRAAKTLMKTEDNRLLCSLVQGLR